MTGQLTTREVQVRPLAQTVPSLRVPASVSHRSAVRADHAAGRPQGGVDDVLRRPSTELTS